MNKLNELEKILFLSLINNDGTRTYWKLIDGFGSLERAFDAPASQLSQLLNAKAANAITEAKKKSTGSPLVDKVKQLQVWSADNEISLLDITHPDYPELLRDISDAPPVLFVKGSIEALSLPQIAIVGSRKPTTLGVRTTQNFAKVLASSGFVITSGLALGTDSAAHQGAINASGRTVAVMATGIDTVYPARNQGLAGDILENGGALVTEFIPGTAARPHHFPERNRIVSGLSCGLLVVEAALKSGSLISARLAVEQNREVFAIPGSIHSPVSKGCHALIKQGAKLVENAQEIVDELDGFLAYQQAQLVNRKSIGSIPIGNEDKELPVDNLAAYAVLQVVDFHQTPLDTILDHVAMPISEVMSGLLELELEGWIEHCGAGYARLR